MGSSIAKWSIESTAFVICSYVLASTFFYYFPNIIHKDRRKLSRNNKNGLLVVSHRGGCGENIENTLVAFKHSKTIGVDVIELDCHITKDGKVVVSHDNHLKRLAGTNGLISDLNYEELPELLDDSYENYTFNHGSRNKLSTSYSNNNNKNNYIDENAKRIPLLEEVFEQFPDMPINLDIKINNDQLINKVNELIVKYNREKLTVWGSFHGVVTQKCYKLNPNISLYFSINGCVKLLLLSLSGLLPFIPLKETYLEIIMPNFILQNNKNLPLGLKAGLWLIKLFLVRRSLFRHLQKRGIMIYLWTLNTEDEFKYAIDMGINGIITDFPTKLIEFIQTDSEYQLKAKRVKRNREEQNS